LLLFQTSVALINLTAGWIVCEAGSF